MSAGETVDEGEDDCVVVEVRSQHGAGKTHVDPISVASTSCPPSTARWRGGDGTAVGEEEDTVDFGFGVGFVTKTTAYGTAAAAAVTQIADSDANANKDKDKYKYKDDELQVTATVADGGGDDDDDDDDEGAAAGDYYHLSPGIQGRKCFDLTRSLPSAAAAAAKAGKHPEWGLTANDSERDVLIVPGGPRTPPPPLIRGTSPKSISKSARPSTCSTDTILDNLSTCDISHDDDFEELLRIANLSPYDLTTSTSPTYGDGLSPTDTCSSSPHSERNRQNSFIDEELQGQATFDLTRDPPDSHQATATTVADPGDTPSRQGLPICSNTESSSADSQLSQLRPPARKKKRTQEELLSSVLIELDTNLIESDGGGEILFQLQKTKARICVKPLPVRQIIKWDFSLAEMGNHFTGFVMRRVPASELFRIIQEKSFAQFAEKTLGALPPCSLTILIEALESGLRKLAIRDQQRIAAGGAAPIPITMEDIIPVFVYWQMKHNINVKLTNTPQDTVNYLVRITETISEAPYRKNTSSLPFCEEQVKPKHTLSSQADIWIAQLNQIPSVSEAIAKAVAAHYPTPTSLVSLYANSELDTRAKELLLAGIIVNEKTHRTVGPVASTRIYKMFSTLDPSVPLL
ncbi:crossover junction endonuclease EME1 [Pelomyxa schiedti]|nr:crossover junction endonuclease EME1 [Pelomyxa schiedti]